MYTSEGVMATGNKRGIRDSNQGSSGLPVPTRTGSARSWNGITTGEAGATPTTRITTTTVLGAIPVPVPGVLQGPEPDVVLRDVEVSIFYHEKCGGEPLIESYYFLKEPHT